jgi:peptide/nickel transport system substrate-binding protein
MLEPDLATSWRVSEDGVEWQFAMREGVRWHDGTLFTVGDAVFSLRRAIDPPPSIAQGRAGAIGRYVAGTEDIRADASNILVRTEYAAASFLPNMASVYLSIYPGAATQALEPPSMRAFETVVGTGPFKAGEVVRGSRYTLNRNQDYFRDGLPYLDAVEFHIIPEPAVRMAALRAHQVDAIAIITDAEAESLENSLSGLVTVYQTPSAGGNTVQMNLRRPPFDDPRVRRAVNLAISRTDVELALGAGFVGAILPPGGAFAMLEAKVNQLPGYGDTERNRAEARRLLADAGFGSGFSTTIHTRANPFFQTLAEFVAGQLSSVGIDARVVPVEAVAYQEMITSGEFDMIGHSHSFALDDPDSVLDSHYGCGGAENFPGLCDPEIDRLVRLQSMELDEPRRKALLNDIERLVWEQDAKVWFQWSARRSPVWNNIVGLEPGGPSLYQGRALDEVYIISRE